MFKKKCLFNVKLQSKFVVCLQITSSVIVIIKSLASNALDVFSTSLKRDQCAEYQ